MKSIQQGKLIQRLSSSAQAYDIPPAKESRTCVGHITNENSEQRYSHTSDQDRI